MKKNLGVFAKAVAEKLFQKISQVAGSEAVAATKKSIATEATGGEIGAVKEVVRVGLEEIRGQIKSTEKVIGTARERTFQEVVVNKAAAKAKEYIPDIVTAMRGAQHGDYSAAQTFVSRAKKIGLDIEPTVFVKKGKESGRDIINRVTKEHLVPHYEKLGYLKVADELATQLGALTTPQAEAATARRALANAKVSFTPEQVNSAKDAVELVRGLDREAAKSISRDLFANTSAARSLQLKGYSETLDVSPLTLATMTCPDTIARLYSFAARNGLTDFANRVENVYRQSRNIDRLFSRVDNLKEGLKKDFSRFDDDIQLKIRDYIQRQNPNNSERMFNSGGMFEDGVLVDRAAATRAGLLDANGNATHGAEPFITAMRATNTFRVTRSLERDIRINDFDSMDKVPQYYDDLVKTTGRTVPGKQGSFSNDYWFVGESFTIPGFDGHGDLGHQYFPIKISEEHRARIAEKMAAGGYGDDARNVQYGYQRMRRIDSKAKIDDIRLSPIEEIDYYFNEYLRSVTKGEGKRKIAELRKVIRPYDPMGVTDKKTVRDLEGIINLIESFHDNMFLPSSDANNKSLITSAITTIADANTTTVLSAANVRMNVFNSLQDWQTTAMFKPIDSVIKAQGAYKDAAQFIIKKAPPHTRKFWSQEGHIEFKKHLSENANDPMIRSSINYYFDRFAPDILMLDTYADKAWVREILGTVTAPYQYTDILSRAKSIIASVDFAKKQLSKFNIRGDDAVSISKNKRDLMRALNLSEFNELDVKELLSKLPNQEAFVNHYAALSTHYEMFHYSRFNKSLLAEKARTFHPIAARATRFLSWNMYYLNLAKGAVRAAEQGNYAPLKSMLLVSGLWWGAMSAASGVDNETISRWGNYGVGRTPFFSPILGLTGQGFNQTYGIAAPSIATMIWPIVKSVDFMTDTISKFMGGNSQNEFDRLEELVYRQMRHQPIVRMPKEILEGVGIIGD